MCAGVKSTGADELDIERTVCGSIREPLMFWIYRSLAGEPSSTRLTYVRNLERVDFVARDGIRLGGYKLAGAAPRKGYLLVAQGNAMLADQLVTDLQTFRDLGFDVYIFDYRGYGISAGKSRLAAIISDYSEIVTHLNALGYRKHLLYGLSMGGVVLLNAVGRSENFHAAVIDSSPSRISNLGCPEVYDPVNHLPSDSSRIRIIVGERDAVVTPEQSKELLQAASRRGASVVKRGEFAHPYQDQSNDIHRLRQKEVSDFLMEHRADGA
jgi:alpha/beta superfamily hydrolase